MDPPEQPGVPHQSSGGHQGPLALEAVFGGAQAGQRAFGAFKGFSWNRFGLHLLPQL